jgi:hypothetical protein
MGIRNSCRVRQRASRRDDFWSFDFRISICVFFLAAGCGAPGDPIPPTPPVPAAITDLSAHQAGDGVELVFTLPAKSVSGEKLATAPAVEILRGALKPSGSPDAKTFRVVYTIPGTLIENYRAKDQIRFVDPISPEETKTHPGGVVAYIVRTRASQKRASADSNAVTVRIFPVPEKIASLQTVVTESAVELSWPAPSRTSAGEALPAISGYRIYRGELDPQAQGAATKDLAGNKWISPLALFGSASANSYRDTQFEFGKTYGYVVRTVITQDGLEIESDNSDFAVVAVLDTFPPTAPQGLVAAVLPGPAPGTVLVDLSWSINLETDLAGYRVYRSEQAGTRGQLITPELLPTPAVRDTSVEPGHRYWYTVTAVDRAGNESPSGEPVAVGVTQPRS